MEEQKQSRKPLSRVNGACVEDAVFSDKDKSEVAEAEFERFIDAWEIDADVDTMSLEDAKSFEQQKRKIIIQLKRGRARVTENGDILYELKKPVGRVSEITLTYGHGASYWDMDKARGEKYIAKLNHYICDAIGQANSVLLKMSSIDVKFIYGVYGLFLNS